MAVRTRVAGTIKAWAEVNRGLLEVFANSTVETVMSCLGPRVTINEMSS